VHELTSSRHGCALIDVVVSRLNSLLRGWWGYFSRFEHHKARSRVNWYVYDRLVRHLRRRSQRPLRPPKNQTWYAFVHSSLGLMRI
jgi:RNA-directed DNA polymerase